MTQLDPELRAVLDEARRLIDEGRVADALAAYAAAFKDRLAKSDHFGASNVAHVAGVAEPEPQAKLEWNRRALAEAEAVADRDSVGEFYPSLYNNLAYSHSLLGDDDEARRCLRIAWSHVGSLKPGAYADRTKQAIRKRLAELGLENTTAEIRFALLHAPLLGPKFWAPTAQELRGRGAKVSVPPVSDWERGEPPYWRRYLDGLRAQFVDIHEPLIVVGHSGAGPLLPLVRRLDPDLVRAVIFVDADLRRPPGPIPDLPLIDKAGGKLPAWANDEILSSVIPDQLRRADVLTEMRPLPAAFFEEGIPDHVEEVDGRAGYLWLSESYEDARDEARRRGWPVREISAGHFHPLVDPAAVASALLDLSNQLPRV